MYKRRSKSPTRKDNRAPTESTPSRLEDKPRIDGLNRATPRIVPRQQTTSLTEDQPALVKDKGSGRNDRVDQVDRIQRQETVQTGERPVRQVRVGRQPDVAFGDQPGLQAKVDYSALVKVTPDTEENFFNGLNTLLGSDEELWPHVESLGENDRWWLTHALYLHASNRGTLPPEFDHAAAVARLLKRAGRHTTMPGDPDQAFEREVLSVGGWAGSVLTRELKPPPDQYARVIDGLYNPRGSGGQAIGPLKKDVLRDTLLPALETMMDTEIGYWRRGDEPLEAEPLDRVRGVASYVQDYVARALGPYPLACQDGPYWEGFRYADRVQSTAELPTEPEHLLNYLRNRAQLIGRAAKYDAPLVQASFDGNRAEDVQELDRLLAEFLKGERIWRSVHVLIKRTGAHTGGEGNISIQPILPNETWGTKADWRWRTLRTLVHEFLHRLAHPAFTAKATTIGHGQVLKEGFVDLLTVDVFAKLAEDVGKSPELCRRLLGELGLGTTPKDSLMHADYGQASDSAETIRRAVGDKNVRAAFFLGATHLIGLP
ncbi:hypothetical protein [Acrocarpospora phusangensis]|uniref:hypothetical protein n=1 Tax=Acrocarpospora phusangensis TaxID=1070424 RepID=UPI00194DE9B5|nr:hypothetical protein [Acrocarpospora phusangensis]